MHINIWCEGTNIVYIYEDTYCDHMSQYMSIIFFHSQLEMIERELSKVLKSLEDIHKLRMIYYEYRYKHTYMHKNIKNILQNVQCLTILTYYHWTILQTTLTYIL